MRKFILTILLIVPLCGSGVWDVVSFPILFKDAQMEIRACGLDINKDGHVDVVILTAGEETEPFKAMMPHEFLEALHPEYPEE